MAVKQQPQQPAKNMFAKKIEVSTTDNCWEGINLDQLTSRKSILEREKLEVEANNSKN
jgi:hypothetical protein